MSADRRAEAAAAAAGVGHLIDGQVVAEGPRLDVDDPDTGRVAAQSPIATADLVDRAARAAAAAQPAWAADLAARRAVIADIARVLEEHTDELAIIESLETGQPVGFTAFDVQGAAWHARHWAEAEIPLDVLTDDETGRVTVERMPLGVVAAIVPWNAPLMMLVNKLATAMLVGDTVVAKPSPFTPLATLRLGALLADVVPPGVVNLVAGEVGTGAALVAHPDVRMISFTGSIATGRSILAAAALQMKRTCLELGGNDAAVVLEDVDLETVAPALYASALGGGGQFCVAIKRLLVHRSRFDETVQRLAALAAADVVGGPYEDGVTMGPIVTRPQFERITGLVEDAVARGATAVTGGAPLDRDGYYYPPTVVIGAGPGVALFDDEQFGPALPVVAFDDVEEALAIANDTPFGLGGSVWTADDERGAALVRRLEVGSAWLNKHADVGPHLPFGGVKQSGMGRENGPAGVDAYAELVTVNVAGDVPAGPPGF